MATRTYRQTRRADATGRTRAAILAAAQELFREDPQLDPSLERLAARAGVSTRTVLRQFGSKEGLLEEAIAAGVAQAAVTRHAEPGDVTGAVRAIVTHYEAMGDEVMRWLAPAERLPFVRRVVERGVETHLEWVETVFALDLAGLPQGARKARRAALATATDVYVWHLLRRREGLGREATEAAMLALVEAARGVRERGGGASSSRGAKGAA
ncbi:MAG TPA: helix-turn-helix domain-containing protein [Solirubrobacterales bacterium]|nr:helix-turn-helix domain-containing protein [Solirubrobacterales bacterium]